MDYGLKLKVQTVTMAKLVLSRFGAGNFNIYSFLKLHLRRFFLMDFSYGLFINVDSNEAPKIKAPKEARKIRKNFLHLLITLYFIEDIYLFFSFAAFYI